MSFVFYVLLALACGFCAYHADRVNKREYVWLLIALLTVVAGFRGISVGIDTISYAEKFDAIQKERLDLAYGLEGTFKCMVYLLMRLVPHRWFVLSVLAFITNWCIISRFWMLRKVSWFPCMVLCYYMSYFFMTMNIMRQFCAVAIVFYGIKYLEEKKIWHYLGIIACAMLFHKSAIIGILYFFPYYLLRKDLPENQKKLFDFGWKILPLIVVAFVILGMRKQYVKFFTTIEVDFGLMLPLKMGFLLVTLFWCFKRYYGHHYLKMSFRKRFQLKTTCISYGIALVIGMLGYIFNEFERIGLYFFLFEGVYFGMLLRRPMNLRRLITAGFIVFVIGYGFIYSMTNNSQGQMPYNFKTEAVTAQANPADDNPQMEEAMDMWLDKKQMHEVILGNRHAVMNRCEL